MKENSIIEEERYPEKNEQGRGKKEDIRRSLRYFDEDPDDFDDIDKQFTFSINIPKETTDSILKISRLVKVAVLTISGYEEIPEEGANNTTTFVLNKEPFATSRVIKSFESILKPYSDESNVITNKSWESFRIQAKSDWDAFYKFCIRSKGTPNQHLRTVYRVFQDCMINIGEIICDNPGNMRHLFGTIGDTEYKRDRRNSFAE